MSRLACPRLAVGHSCPASFQAQGNDDTGGATIAIGQPRIVGTYYVIFTLYAPNGTKLSVQNSPNFNIT